MYPIFLLYGIFIFSAIFLVLILLAIIAEFVFLFFPTTLAEVLNTRIVITSARKTYLGDIHELFIKYQYDWKGVTYTSTALNTFGGVRRFGKNSIKKILYKSITSENTISVHVCPFYPKLAYAMPFRWDKILVLPIAGIVLFGFIFSGLKLSIF